MNSWSRIWKRGGEADSSFSDTPVQQTSSVDDCWDAVASGSSPPYEHQGGAGTQQGGLREGWRGHLPRPWGRVRVTLTRSWGSLLQKRSSGAAQSEQGPGGVHILPNGTRVSPPVSPLPQGRGSFTPTDLHPLEGSELSSLHLAEQYAEKLEVYNMKYSYLKSWPGMLRLLAGMELLFAGMVFACVCAYIQKDSQWSSAYGLHSGVSEYHYGGPMTPFVLAVVGLCWVATLLLLVMGFTMYYRSILLDAPWWPLTEAAINIVLFLLYMAAGIVYLNDLNRGGLCYMTVGVNPLLSSLCRVDGGQMAGAAFIFITMAMYLVSFLVCLKMWRHEAARQERQRWERGREGRERQHWERGREEVKLMDSSRECPLRGVALSASSTPRRIVFEDEMGSERQVRTSQHKNSQHWLVGLPTAPDYTSKPRADYILKFPAVQRLEERDDYRTVFNSLYQEYRELHAEVSATLDKFTRMDAMMDTLLRNGDQGEKMRIDQLLKKYEKKKNDQAFLEKKERCEYLKAKLSHIKDRIREYDQKTET